MARRKATSDTGRSWRNGRSFAEWLTAGSKESRTINQVLTLFRAHAERFYRRPDGSQTSEIDNLKQAARYLRELYGNTPAAEFGPLMLKAVRERMIEQGWCRTNINKQVNRIRLIFKWAGENELVPARVHAALTLVAGLRRGRSDARESEPVRPVPQAHIDAIQPYVSAQVWALIQLQLLTGARAGELLGMRSVDLNTSGTIWTYTIDQHKTAHHGHERRIYLGPRAQEIVKLFLAGRSVDAFMFSPAEAESERLAERSANRNTPLSCGNRPGTNRVKRPKCKPDDRYTVASYRRAITRACEQAFPLPEHLQRGMEKRMIRGKLRERLESEKTWLARLSVAEKAELRAWRRTFCWHPHQLRHNAATTLRKEFGIEAAKVILGHRSISMTAHYAEQDHAKAIEVIAKVG